MQRRISISLPAPAMALLAARVAAARGPRKTRSGQVAECIGLASGIETRHAAAVRGRAQRIGRAVEQLRQRVAGAEVTALLDAIAGEAAELLADAGR